MAVIAVVAVAVVAILVVAALLYSPGSSAEDLVGGTADTTMMLGPGDLGQNWAMGSNNTITIQPGSQNDLEGVDSVGTVLLNMKASNDTVVCYLSIELAIYDSIENAEAAYGNATSPTSSFYVHMVSPSTAKAVSVGDQGLLADALSVVSDDGTCKILFFRERNVVCALTYCPLDSSVVVTDDMIIDAANKQIAKL